MFLTNKWPYRNFAGLTIIRFSTALKYFDLISKISENQGLIYYTLLYCFSYILSKFCTFHSAI